MLTRSLKEPASPAQRFPIKRIAVTVPPGDWFHGIAHALFEIYREALVALGFDIFDVPVDAFLPPDAARIAHLLSDLKAFQPELACGLPKGSYALRCRLPPRRDGWRPNLFTEVLEIPTICLWDHAPLELADQLLTPHPEDPAASVSGAYETLRRSLTHPLLLHWSPDTGQTQIMEELGFLLPNHLIQESPPCLPGFWPEGTRSGLKDGRTPNVGFVGHFYQEPPGHPDPALGALAERAIQTWLPATGRPLWYLLAQHIAALDPDLRKRLSLHLDQTYFWHFSHRLILHQAQTALRLSVLGSTGVPVACYGNLKTEEPGVPRNLTPVPGHIPFGPELAAALARHTIAIDVFNPGFIHGYSHKPLMAFAAGGFMLVNRKRDFIAAFGEAGEAISYEDDLGAKVDRFLTNPAYLREVGEAIRETMWARFQLKQVLARVLEAAFRSAEGARADSIPLRSGEQITMVVDLLGTMRSEPDWSDASVEHLEGAAWIVAPHQWWFAAAIQIPESVKTMAEPHVRLNIIVDAGRIGVAALLDTGVLLAEQYVSATTRPVNITVELPYEGVSNVILRSTTGTTSRARVLEAGLCDRATRPA